jgi:hemolysin D
MSNANNGSGLSQPGLLAYREENGASPNGTKNCAGTGSTGITGSTGTNGSTSTIEPTDAHQSRYLSQVAPMPAQSEEWSHVTRDLLDTLPRVWARGLLYLLVVSTAILLPWATLSKVEETGQARGRLEPQGKMMQLDAPVAGTVSQVQVEEGSTIKAGQVLLELESDVLRNELQQAESKREGLLDRLTQLEVMKGQLEVVSRSQRLQNQAQISAQLAQIKQTQQEVNFKQSAYRLNQDLLAKAETTAGRLQSAYQEGVVSLLQLEEAERSLIDTQKLVEQTQSEIQHAQSEQSRQQSAYDGLIHEGEVTFLENRKQIEELQAQLIDIKAELTQTKTQIESLKFQLQQRTIKSPIDGVLFQIPIKGAGEVVQASERIAEIAPKGTPLILKAQMPSQESGFLQVGMPVKIKFDAYPFQDYGVVKGSLKWISPDSKKVQVNQGEMEVFEVNVALDQPYIQTPNKRVTLTPGQTATAEVVVRQRRVIDFVLDPFKKLQQGGLEF